MNDTTKFVFTIEVNTAKANHYLESIITMLGLKTNNTSIAVANPAPSIADILQAANAQIVAVSEEQPTQEVKLGPLTDIQIPEPARRGTREERVLATLKQYQKENGLNQYALARMLSVSSSTTHNWMTRGVTPSKKSGKRIANFLKSQGYTVAPWL